MLKESQQGIIYPEPEEVKTLQKQVQILKDAERMRPHQTITEAINALENEINEQRKKLGYEFEKNKQAIQVLSNHEISNLNY